MKDAIEKRINDLYKKHGTITADIVIEDAKKPESPLHDEFEWDVKKAAMTAWRETARRLIRSVTIHTVVESHSIAVPRYVHAPKNYSEQSYTDTREVKTDRERAADLMRYEIQRLESIATRVRGIASVLGMEKEIITITKTVDTMKKKMKPAVRV
jgi:hypothetical protein